jgi:SAF domain
MASTTLGSRSQGSTDQARPVPSLVPGGGRQRRWSLALLAVLVTLGSALGFVVLWMNAGGREPVLALKNDVAAGSPIRAEDLAVVRVATDPGIRPVASSARDDVIGRPAAIDLLAGTLLVAKAVGDDKGLDEDTSVIAIPIARSQAPPGLETGNRVELYRTPSGATGDEEQLAVLIGEGRVFSVTADENGGSEISVSVTVKQTAVPEIAAAIQPDRIYTVLAGGG